MPSRLHIINTQLNSRPLHTQVIRGRMVRRHQWPTHSFIQTTVHLFPRRRVGTTIMVTNIVGQHSPVFLNPVNFGMNGQLVIGATSRHRHIQINIRLTRMFTVLFRTTLLLPRANSTQTILPTIRTTRILVSFRHTRQRPNARPQVGASVSFTTQFEHTRQVTLTNTSSRLLQVNTTRQFTRPQLQRLPRRHTLTTMFTHRFNNRRRATRRHINQRFVRPPNRTLTNQIANRRPVTNHPRHLTNERTGALVSLSIRHQLTQRTRTGRQLPFRTRTRTNFNFVNFGATS